MTEQEKVQLRLELFKQAIAFKSMKPDADVLKVFKLMLKQFPEISITKTNKNESKKAKASQEA